MKTTRLLASILLFAITAVMAMSGQYVAAAATLFAGSLCLVQPADFEAPAGSLFNPTMTPAVLLLQTMRAIWAKAPALQYFSHEFTTERLKKGQTVTGKVRLRPTVRTYAGNYETDAQESRTLLLDVGPFVMDQHVYTTVKLSDLYALQDKVNAIQDHFKDQAEEIGNHVSRYLLGLVDSRAFSNASTYSVANSNLDALNAIRFAMNERGVPGGRFGLINSGVAGTLVADSRITNRYDSKSRDVDNEHLIMFDGLAGFNQIREDSALASGTDADTVAATGEADNETFTLASAKDWAVNQRVLLTISSGGTGITTGYYFIKTKPSTTTLTLSATRGGATAAFSLDAVATLKLAENITGFFGSREAIAIKTALPDDGIRAAEAFGIPVPVSSEVVTDPNTGLSMIAYKWFKPGSMDAYMTLASLFGGVAGAVADTGGYVMEPAGHILRSA